MGRRRVMSRAWGWRALALGLAAVGGVVSLERVNAATDRTAYAANAAEFSAAVRQFRWTGGTIVLRAGRHDRLAVGRRGPLPLTIRAEDDASVGLVELDRARAVRLVGLELTPRRVRAGVEATEVTGLRIEDSVFSGGSTGRPAGVNLGGSTGVTIAGNTFTRCGDRSVCILTGRASRVRILDNEFHDCYGCDFIRGNFGRSLLIRGNRFDRALVGPCGIDPQRCNHQEMIELHAGSRLVIEENRFGVFEPPGAGQVALFGPLKDVLIRNNLFLRTDPRMPGLVARVGINLGGHTGHPQRVVIANNTILAGRAHWRGFANSIRFKPTMALMPEGQRPVVANNIIDLAATPHYFCRSVRLAVRNVIERGKPCSSSDVVGPANLHDDGRPTEASRLVLGRGSARWAPPVDMVGTPRGRPPDIGAFEHAP